MVKLADDGIQTTSNDLQRPAVVICGGGPGELLASILLNNIGIKLTVVEQAMENISGRIRLHTIILNKRGENLALTKWLPEGCNGNKWSRKRIA